MNQIIAMTRKEILLWAQKPGSWIIVFVVPMIFIWIIMAIFGGSGTPVVTVFAVNEDEGSEGARIIAALREADNLEIEELDTREEADRRVGSGERMAAVFVPEGFSEEITTRNGGSVEIIIDPARAEQANIVFGLVNASIAPIIVDAEVSRGVAAGVDQIMASFDESSTPESPTGEEPEHELPGSSLPGENQAGAEQPGSGLPTIEPPGSGIQSSDRQGDEEQPTDQPGGETQAGSPPGMPELDQPDTSLPFAEQPQGQQPPGTGNDGQSNLGSVDLDALRLFFTSALKGIVSSQVQDALNNPQVQLSVRPYGERQDVRRPSLLDYLVPGYSLMFVFFLISSLAMTVVDERDRGTLRRLLVAPVPRSRILLGKMLPYFLIAVVQFVVVLAASSLIFRIDLGDSPAALALVIIASALAMAGLGILIASLARTEGQADGLAIVVVLAMAVVSGAMFPSISIPWLKLVTPHYWAMQGFLNVISLGNGIEGVLRPAGVLLTMAAVFFTIGAIRFRFE